MLPFGGFIINIWSLNWLTMWLLLHPSHPTSSGDWVLSVMSSNTNVWTNDFLWFILLCWDKTLNYWTVVKSSGRLVFIVTDLLSSHLRRRRGHHLSVSAGTRRTPCAVVVGPRPTTCRSPPAASVATPRSARESVSHLMACFDMSSFFIHNIAPECAVDPKMGT